MTTSSQAGQICAPSWLTTLPIAHRGLHKLPDTPENSLAAFHAAANAGYPAEMDVRLLADGRIAVFHDADLYRMTGVPRTIAASHAPDLNELFLLGTGNTIPLLEEVLETVAGRTPLLIEVKSDKNCPVGPLEDALMRLLSTYGGAFALQSFRVETVFYLKKLMPQWCIGQLASNDEWAAGLEFSQNGLPPPDFLAYNLGVVPTSLTSDLHDRRGIPLIVWTVANMESTTAANSVADNYIFDHIRPILPKEPHPAL